MNGPVPTAVLLTPSGPTSRAQVGEYIDQVLDDSTGTMCGAGAVRFTRTVRSSTTSIESHGIEFQRGSCSSILRSKLYLTASASNGVPSWNVTPGCSVKV